MQSLAIIGVEKLILPDTESPDTQRRVLRPSHGERVGDHPNEDMSRAWPDHIQRVGGTRDQSAPFFSSDIYGSRTRGEQSKGNQTDLISVYRMAWRDLVFILKSDIKRRELPD